MSPTLHQWTAHPARRRPREVALVVAVVSTTAGVVLLTFQSAYLALLSVVLLVASITPFLFPTRYVVTAETIEARRLFTRRSRRFGDLRRLDVGPAAALLSPLRKPSMLDRVRGLVVLFDGLTSAARAQVIELLRSQVKTTHE